MTTTTRDETLQEVLEKADLNTLADALRKVGLAYAGTPFKATFTGLTSAAAQDITSDDARNNVALVGRNALRDGENLPPIGTIVSLRVTAGTAAAGNRQVSDAGAAPSATVATLSDDGKTLTFEAPVTGYVITYIPRSKTALTDKFAPSA